MATVSPAGKEPLVTVILATYNREAFIQEAIDSILAQTWSNLELIVVDDGSTDNTKEVLSRYRAEPRYRFLEQKNQGRAAAFNYALGHAQGDFIAVLDSDNRWLPDRLKKGLQEFEKDQSADIVYGDCVLIDEAGAEVSRKNMRRFSGCITRHLWRDNCVSINTALVRKKCFDELGGMDPGRRRADDYELWLRFSTKYRFNYIPELLSEYRVMENQISSDKRGRFEANESILRDFQKRYPTAMSSDEFNEGWAFFYTRRARYFARSGNQREAWSSILCALRHKLFHRAPWRAAMAIAVRPGSRVAG